MNRGSILHEDLTYAMLHEMVMKKFNLEAIYPLNLSAKVSSIDDNFDITDDHENNESNHQNESHFKKPECSFAFEDYNEYEDEKKEFDDVVDDNPLTNYQKWQKYMSFKPDIPETPLYKSKPMISKDYKKETEVKVGNIFDNKESLNLDIRLKALNEGYQFLSDKSTPERYALKCFHFNEYAAHLKGRYKGTNLIVVGMDGNNQIVPIDFGICKGETGLCWSWWMSVLKECIGDNSNLLFISDRHVAIALAVQIEFPLAYQYARLTQQHELSTRYSA
ncbi:transposase, MuDR, MULE transposase domain protein [Tanacetum coccineum]